jgi:hypothetical protein
MKKILTWGAIAFLIFFIAYAPDSAGEVFRSIGNGVVRIFTGFGRFVQNLGLPGWVILGGAIIAFVLVAILVLFPPRFHDYRTLGSRNDDRTGDRSSERPDRPDEPRS